MPGIDQSTEEVVLGNVAQFQNELKAVIKTMASATSGRPDAAPVTEISSHMHSFSVANTDLQYSLEVLKEHVKVQRKIESLQEEIAQVDDKMLNIATTLASRENELESLVYNAKKLLPQHLRKHFGVNEPRTGDTLGIAGLIEFARTISYTTGAPRGWHFSQARDIPPPYKPPAPQSENMKQGLLFTSPQQLLRLVKQSASNAAASSKQNEGGTVDDEFGDIGMDVENEDSTEVTHDTGTETVSPENDAPTEAPRFDLGLSDSDSDSDD